MDLPLKGFKELDINDPYTGPGTYLLLMDLISDHIVPVGSLGEIEFKKGRYVYVGSAKAGLWGRVKRHLSEPKKKRWHIDRIASLSISSKVFWKEHSPNLECDTARILNGGLIGIRGFGCSDCSCGSHLFYIGSGQE